MVSSAFIACVAIASCMQDSKGLKISSFHGNTLDPSRSLDFLPRHEAARLTMRKQKASDKRTRRMQRGQLNEIAPGNGNDSMSRLSSLKSSPMASASWGQRSLTTTTQDIPKTGGRGRSRKRCNLYNSLASYQNKFINWLTNEYQAEVYEVKSRIESSIENPLGLETAGHAIFDLFAERRGNLFSDEVYRLVKAKDATTTFPSKKLESTNQEPSNASEHIGFLPPNHKFSINDVVVLTLQHGGSGDFFDKSSLPTDPSAVAVEARVLNKGPTYIDVALHGGAFESTFGPAPNNIGPSGRGNKKMRLRADRFFSNVPYTRMVTALSQITAIPHKITKTIGEENNKEPGSFDNICMDELLREAILSTFAFTDQSSLLFHDTDECDLREMAKLLAKPPLTNSQILANQVLRYIEANPQAAFSNFNGPQLTAIGAALTRRLMLIQGPPGTGKTTVAAAIGFGFVHQCRSISSNTKVLACAFSNVGADNLAEQLLRLGLKVVRIGKASAVSKSLWDHTLDALVAFDPEAQKAMENAAWATAQLTSKGSSRKEDGGKRKESFLSERSKREVATRAVKASIQASNVAATKALREADVIVSTSTSAADPRLLATCGFVSDDEQEINGRLSPKGRHETRTKLQNTDPQSVRTTAPDGLPPLSLPFVLVDEACQSVEPAALIPLTSTNSCRALVLLGDPCQLPPTLKSDPSSPLSISLMERLAATLPQPVIVTGRSDQTDKDDRFLESKPIKQAVSLLRSTAGRGERHVSYRKRYEGSLLLSVQYRMHPSISAFSSSVFYDGLLSTPAFLSRSRKFPSILQRQFPVEESSLGVRFVNVGGRGNERRRSSSRFLSIESKGQYEAVQPMSYWNEPEAKLVVDTIKRTLREAENSTTIGVVTPYNAQKDLIESLLESDDEYTILANDLSSPVEVNSVDGYQGRERDVIIFSAVRSNRQGSVGFLSDWRRMNVALTRAKSALVVIGDMETLVEGDKHWAAFEKWCQGAKCIVHGRKHKL